MTILLLFLPERIESAYSTIVQYYDKIDNQTVSIPEEELITQFKNLIRPDERLIQIHMYKCPMWNWQLTKWIVYHAFIVFQTSTIIDPDNDPETNWWSVEKTADRVTIQRSKNLEDVRDHYGRSRRAEQITQVLIDPKTRGSVHSLIEHLHYQHLVGNGYNLLWNNCKHFASNLFNKFAADLWCRVGTFDCLNH